MTEHTPRRTPIMVAQTDYELLSSLALAALGKSPGAALLIEKLSRAKVVSQLPAFVAGMGSVATFTYNGSHYRDYELVYPQSADFAQHRISVLTPVGAMLLGLAEGQAIEWTSDDSVTHRIALDQVSSRTPAAR